MSEPCAHNTVSFGSGGHYIFCANCQAVWCSKPDGDGIMDDETYKAAMSNVCQTGIRGGERTLRTVFYIDVGDMDPTKAKEILDKVREEYIKKKDQ